MGVYNAKTVSTARVQEVFYGFLNSELSYCGVNHIARGLGVSGSKNFRLGSQVVIPDVVGFQRNAEEFKNMYSTKLDTLALRICTCPLNIF